MPPRPEVKQPCGPTILSYLGAVIWTEDLLGKVELGVKLTCDSCGARFYDLNKTPAKCPKCGAANSRPVVFKTRRPTTDEREESKRAAAAAAAAKAAKPAEDEVEVVAGDDEDEAVIEDTSDLGEDDDNVDVVVEEEP